ncbi:hypothetical protein CHU98_g6623 [Xylaria longipes]|nr:hypothetical protein CHU98_g6623 [Xylaria longipes]
MVAQKSPHRDVPTSTLPRILVQHASQSIVAAVEVENLPGEAVGGINEVVGTIDASNTYFVAIIATVGGMLFGFDISSIAAIVITPQYIEYFHNPSGVVQGAIGSALAAGSVVGSLMAGPISNKFGRRDSIMFACFWWLIGTAVQVSTNGVGSRIAGRVLNGVCVGITSSQVPVYLAEIAKRESRGRIIIIQQLAIEWGIFIMYFASYGCGFIQGTASFRTAWGLQFIPAVLLMIGLPFLPRSPRWVAKVGREEEAIQTLADIQAGGNKDDALVIAEWEEIYTVLAAERESVHGWRKFVSNGKWKRTLAGMSVQAWQRLSGANVIVYYLTYVFLIAGLQCAGWRGGNANVTFKVGGPASHTGIAFSYLLIIIYALTLAPVAWIYAAEVWSLETRATGMSPAAVANWLFNFALGLFTPPAFQNIQYKVFIIFGVLCVGSAIQAFLTYPETCGKTIEEVEQLFAKGAPAAWKTKKGGSRLEAEVRAVLERKQAGEAVHAEAHGETEKFGSAEGTKEDAV